jgi:hypothetical protein
LVSSNLSVLNGTEKFMLLDVQNARLCLFCTSRQMAASALMSVTRH